MSIKIFPFPFSLVVFLFFIFPTFPLYAGVLDFYSDIDDAGESLSKNLVTRQLSDYGTFRDFGKRCRGQSSWLDTEPLSESLLKQVNEWVYTDLMVIAQRKKISITTTEFNTLVSCLRESYQEIQSDARTEQNAIDTVGSIGLYNDGDTSNSDFDIIDDINKINTIIFKEDLKYEWRTNPTSKSLTNFLRGNTPSKLFSSNSDSGNSNTSGENNSGNTHTGSPENTESSENNSTNSNTENSNSLPPWAQTCTDNTTQTTESQSVNGMLDTHFMNDLKKTLGWNGDSWNGTDGSKGNTTQNGGYDYSEKTRTNNTSTDNGPSEDSSKDFFDKIPCDDVFCITLGAKVSTQDALVWGKNNSIESILDKHIEKTDEISWSDLSAQKMNNNSFQLPFLNVKLSSQVAWGRVFFHDSPQSMKNLKSEDTDIKKEARFDQAYNCAMIDAGLSLDELKNAGITGAGYILKDGHDISNISNAISPLDPVDQEKLQAENNCGTAYTSMSRSNNAVALAGQLGEIQAFTTAILDIINQILETEMRLDTVKSK